METNELENYIWDEIRKSPLSTRELREKIVSYIYGNDDLEGIVQDLATQFEGEDEEEIKEIVKNILK